MNALKLADEWGKNYDRPVMAQKIGFAMQAMLRKQHAEIENLRKIAEEAIKQGFYEDDFHKAQKEIEALKQQYKLYGAVWEDKHGYQFTAKVGKTFLNDDRWVKVYKKID